MKNIEDKDKNEFEKIMKEFTKIKEEGNELYKKKQIEIAKKRYMDGRDYYEKNVKSFLLSASNEQYNDIISIYVKILSNLALCYYKQGQFKESIIYDLEIIAFNPKFAKSIVRLIRAYSKVNNTSTAVYMGKLFLDLEQDIKNKVKGIEELITEQKRKLKKIQNDEESKKKFIKFVPILILLIAIIYKFILKK